MENWESTPVQFVQPVTNISGEDRAKVVDDEVHSMLEKEQEVIGTRQLASVVGLLESTKQAILPRPLHFRALQQLLNFGIKKPGEFRLFKLKAASLALRSFVSADTQHVLLRLDNVTAVAYVNHVGGTRSPDLAALALEMWSWALERGLTLSATHVPGLTNTLADSLVFKVLRKVQSDVAIVILIPPVWKSQAWYPKVLNMLFESPVLLPQSWDLLFLPHNRRPHPLLPDLMLAAWPRSGDSCRVGAFRQGLQTSSCRLGEKALLDSISQHGLSGPAGVIEGRLIQFAAL
ncbi:hypothetical protein Bbelb_421870 [Branchiostoma belcheri]|nr:hypothetical protein Bbelb_421870 [Branchiostoma belcheri]